MAARISDTPPEKRATIARFLYRQFFVTPPLPHDVDLQGKTAMVTGSNTGLGLECARQLLDLGLSKLIIAVRDESKGHIARKGLLSGRKLEDGAIEVWKLDLLSYDSIISLVERTKELHSLDIVVLNAGVMKKSYEVAASTGHEQTIQVNVLSTALLMILLLPILKTKTSAKDPGRIVVVSSDMASWAKFKERNTTPLLPAFDKPESFKLPDRYSTSRLLSQLFVTEIAKRVPSSVAIVTMPNPGLCYGTGLGRSPGGSAGDTIASFLKRIVGRSTAVGARAITDGAVNHGPEAHGQYLEDCRVQPKAPIVYKPEGDRLATLLWAEVMAELSFARVEDILQELGE
ncbi:hypothetical protein DL767_006483 [Monosporascus sp. MG133]|nr:hypothetical protein DL767_006483 [Monosporascus sp. MG133]